MDDTTNSGRAVPDGLSPTVEPVARLNPSGFDPSRCWQPIETAPSNTPFLALNHDGEVWVARIVDNRLMFRTHQMRETRRWFTKMIDGEEWQRVDTEWEHHADEWQDCWCFWTRGYDFKPTLWAKLERPPAIATEARRDETTEIGSVHEGAGGEAVSPKDSQ